ncbi:Non-classical phosphatidylinositol transfer protein (PITP) [Plenodomus biglobosus]|nr:Non-classical phosphatidylinositol transfer protein (PITP) [Plenodomus biglobosus]
MADKQEQVSVAPPEGASIIADADLDQKPEAGLTAASAGNDGAAPKDDTKVDDATAGVAGLSVSEDKTKEGMDASAATPSPVVDSSPPAPAAVVTDDSDKATEGVCWPETAPDHPLSKFYDAFEALVNEAAHNEVYGIELSKSNPFLTKLILQKFLRANQNDLDAAKGQLLETLKWRKEFDPIKAAGEGFERSKFDGLGYILKVEGVPGSPNATDIATFNIYGAVKDNKATFGDLDAFLRWRVGLMEKSIQALDLSSATKPIPNFGEGPDPYQGFQVHDYLQVSFLRRDPLVKTATSKTIEILGKHYPETLSRKFFVNVPVVMGWVYTAMKMVVAKETAKKFTVLSYGKDLAGELGKGVPQEYGGEKGSLKEVGEAVKLVD